MWEVISKLIDAILSESKQKDAKIEALEENLSLAAQKNLDIQSSIKQYQSKLESSEQDRIKLNKLKNQLEDMKKNYCQTVLLYGKPCNDSIRIQAHIAALEDELEQIHDSRKAYNFHINGSDTTDCHEVQQYIDKLEELTSSKDSEANFGYTMHGTQVSDHNEVQRYITLLENSNNILKTRVKELEDKYEVLPYRSETGSGI